MEWTITQDLRFHNPKAVTNASYIRYLWYTSTLELMKALTHDKNYLPIVLSKTHEVGGHKILREENLPWNFQHSYHQLVFPPRWCWVPEVWEWSPSRDCEHTLTCTGSSWLSAVQPVLFQSPSQTCPLLSDFLQNLEKIYEDVTFYAWGGALHHIATMLLSST